MDKTGKLSLRYAGRLRHIGIGRAYAGTHILMLIHDTDATISDITTGEIIRELRKKSRHRDTKRAPEGALFVNILSTLSGQPAAELGNT